MLTTLSLNFNLFNLLWQCSRFFLIIIEYIWIPPSLSSIILLAIVSSELLLEHSNPLEYLPFKGVILVFTEIMLALPLEAFLTEI